MFSRLRATITGDLTLSPIHPNQSPVQNSTPSSSQHQQQQQTRFLPPNFVPPFFRGESFGSDTHDSSNNRPRSVSTPSKSPRTIRASASALLNLATPPLFITPSNINQQEDDTDGISSQQAVDMEQRETLEHQLNLRDARISKLQQEIHAVQNQYHQLQRDHITLRRQQLESQHRHIIAIKLWTRTNEGLGARICCFEKETTVVAAREIASLIRDAAPTNKDSAYLMTLQDQLNKATLKLEHLGSQTEIVLQKGEEVVESLREEINEVIRERSRMEIELLDQEKMLEEDKKRMITRTEWRLKMIQGEIDFLEKKAVEKLKDEENEDAQKVKDTETFEGNTSVVVAENSANEDNGVESNEIENEITCEKLRRELHKLSSERDRTVSLLRSKLRDKNEEYMSLMRLKDSRVKEVQKLEEEKNERENWRRSREDILTPS